MKKIPRRKRPLLVASAILLIAIIIYCNPRMKGYNVLLEADTMNVYSDGSLVGTFAEPRDILHTFNETIVGVGVVDISRIDLRKSDFKELYTHKVGTTAPYPLARTVSVEPPPRTGRTPLDVSGSPFVYHQESII